MSRDKTVRTGLVPACDIARARRSNGHYAIRVSNQPPNTLKAVKSRENGSAGALWERRRPVLGFRVVGRSIFLVRTRRCKVALLENDSGGSQTRGQSHLRGAVPFRFFLRTS